MALIIGNARIGTGLAGEIKAAIELELQKQYRDDFDAALAEKGLIAFGDAIATAVISHIKVNADLELSGVDSGIDTVIVTGPGAIE